MAKKETGDFVPVEIKINLLTNIPDSDEYVRDVLSFSKLYTKDLKIVKRIRSNAYPLFTYQVRYSEYKLALLNYAEIVTVFFDPDEFFETFAGGETLEYNAPNNGTEKEMYYKTRTDNINNNVMLMLKYLLPTGYPAVNNLYSSYDLFNGADSMASLFFNPFSTRERVFLQLSSGIFTIRKIVWLNDFLNHPEYKKVLKNQNPDVSQIKTRPTSNNQLITKLQSEELKKDPATFLEDIKKCYNMKGCSPENTNNLYVGMFINDEAPNPNQKTAVTPYEIFINIELIMGEMKTGEDGTIKCAFFSDHLGEMLLKLYKKGKSKRKNKKSPYELEHEPLYNISLKISSKKGDISISKGKEGKDDVKAKLSREEDEKYNAIDSASKFNYDKVMGDILNRIRDGTAKVPTATKSLINTYGINKKNLYFFLQLQFFELLSYMNTEKSELENDPKSIDLLSKQWFELINKQKELNIPRNTQYRDPAETAKQRATITVLLTVAQILFMSIKPEKRTINGTVYDVISEYINAKIEANKALKEKSEEETKAKIAKEKIDADTKAKAETKAKEEAEAKAKADAAIPTVGGRSRKIKNKRRGKYTRKL